MRRRACSPAALALAALALAGLVAAARVPAASGDVFGPTSLLSTTPSEQAIYARDPALAANGRYVAFDGDYGGQTGVWRRALAGGAIEPVSVGPPGSALGSAELPSISADGRYVSFTTLARLDPTDDTNAGPDVYVRDMDDPDGESCPPASAEEQAAGEEPPCAFVLASARDGSSAGLAYSFRNPGSEERSYGSIAGGRSAISADGQRVVFVTTAGSDLAGAGTPALQVAVRDIPQRTTQLVSVRYDPATGAPAVDPATGQPEPVSSPEGAEAVGAVFTGSGAHVPPFRAPQPREVPPPIGASISADGSTVAWMGTDVALQAPMLAGESAPPKYSEPLWRRIGDGPLAPTLRVTGGSDPAAAACATSSETAPATPPSPLDPCQGPFETFADPAAPGVVSGVEGDEVIPRVSADGYTVAFLANAPLVALGEGFGLGDGHADLYVADMRPGRTRTQALRALTELAGGVQTDLATTAPIIDLAVSPDGSEVAFTTKRTQFPLGSPADVSAPDAAAGMAELFDVDLADDTLTQVTQGFEGGPSEHPHEPAGPGEDPYPSAGDGALSPSFSGDGDTLAFSSTASNLVYGDGNTPPAAESFGQFDGSDVFAVSRAVSDSTPAPQQVAPAPGDPAPRAAWALGLTATSQRDGSVLLEAGVPGAGRLLARATSAVPLRGAPRAAGAERVRRARRAAERVRGAPRPSRVSGRAGDAHTSLASEAVARAALVAAHQGLVELRLRLSRRDAALAATMGGLSATVAVTFAAPGHRLLRRSLEVTFLVPEAARRGSRAARSRRRSARRG